MPAEQHPGRQGIRKIGAQAERIDSDLAAIRHAMRKPAEAEFAQAGLTVPQTALMRAVVLQNGVSLKELSRQLSLAHSTVSGIVDRLEGRGLLVRHNDPQDGRISRIHPAPEVKEFLRTQLPALTQGPLQAALKRAKPRERNAIEQTLRRLRQLLEEARSPAV
ncbi:MAG: MarR family transcriptional regulator [Terracidiphilus sp.]|nr:MarR family transcriptional regulator [Terracidiphilus sp.]